MPAPWDGRLATYLGHGAFADRPLAPNTAPGLMALWYSTDLNTLSLWYDYAWSDFEGSGGIPEAPSDGSVWGRKDGSWEPVTVYDDEMARDAVAAALVAGANVTITPDDTGNTITVSATVPAAYTDEQVRDVVGATLVAGTNVTITADDAGDTITISAPGGTSYTDEQVRDVVGATLVAGANVTITPDDAGDTITIAATGGTAYTDEQVRDVIGAALVAGSNVTITPNDVGDTITIAASAAPTPRWDYSPPLASQFTLASGDATNLTLSDDADVGLLFDAGARVAGPIMRAGFIPLTDKSLDWTLVVKMQAMAPDSNYGSWQPIVLRDTISGRLTAWEHDNQNFLRREVINWASLTGARASAGGTSILRWPCYWKRVRHSASSYIFEESVDGKQWQTILTVSETAYLTNKANQVGFGAFYQGTVGLKYMGNIEYWSLTGPGA